MNREQRKRRQDIINPAMVDAYEYINDYDFPYEININDDLSIFVKLEKGLVLSIGITAGMEKFRYLSTAKNTSGARI